MAELFRELILPLRERLSQITHLLAGGALAGGGLAVFARLAVLAFLAFLAAPWSRASSQVTKAPSARASRGDDEQALCTKIRHTTKAVIATHTDPTAARINTSRFKCRRTREMRA